MSATNVTVVTEDGECAATLHTPLEGASARPGVILYVDIAGVRQTFVDMADRLADFGYAVLLPDIYYRTEHAPFDVTTMFSDPDEHKRLREVVGQLTVQRSVADTGAFLDFLAGRPEVAGARMGTTGYCMGGHRALLAAARYPDRVAAAASFHGGNLADINDPDSPYLEADRIRASVYVAGAENDESFPPEQYERLQEAFVGAGTKHIIETYPARHGFAVPDNPTYDVNATARHWEALRDLYAATLPGR